MRAEIHWTISKLYLTHWTRSDSSEQLVADSVQPAGERGGHRQTWDGNYHFKAGRDLPAHRSSKKPKQQLCCEPQSATANPPLFENGGGGGAEITLNIFLHWNNPYQNHKDWSWSRKMNLYLGQNFWPSIHAQSDVVPSTINASFPFPTVRSYSIHWSTIKLSISCWNKSG